MGSFRTGDGFEFDTTAHDGVIRCVCRRDGEEAVVVVEHGLDDDCARSFAELIELGARNLWLAQRRIQARNEGRDPPG